ncbi:MAG: hypothetical protein BEN19_08840 [Epulopiscium sp. Nuni2H_MBin003]|nr:MAG: hypothetical protein BEN19_08840 [Epulopiscium sp. Nuni2H_MBin003]
MKTLIAAINAKYIHSNLAIYYLKHYCGKNHNVQTAEFTINQYSNDIIKSIYKSKPDILGFSCYIWSISMILEIIPTIKKILPDIKIILGGPEVSYNSRELLDIVDIIIEGEGEAAFKECLDYWEYNKIKLSDIDGIVYKKDDKIMVTKERKPLSMDQLPFVYKDINQFNNKIIYYEASRGCPFRCSYCLSSIQKGVRFMPIERVLNELDHFLQHNVAQVKFVDRTFNANKEFAMKIFRHIIEHDNQVTNFHFEIATNLLTDDMVEILKEARVGLIQFEIGVQSTNIKTLSAINRDLDNIKYQLPNIHQHLDLIVGLPHEDYNSFKQSFNDVIALRPEQLQLGFLKVLKGSQLYYEADKYGIIYKSSPPYEVLFTKYINYDKISRLYTVCNLVDRYYNTNRFGASLEYLYNMFKSPFNFFEQFAIFWEENGYDEVSHKKQAYYLLLLKFASSLENINLELIKELIKWDWLLHENVHNHITELETIDQDKFKQFNLEVLKDVDVLNKIGAVSHRSLRIEHFRYDVYNRQPKLEQTAILFNYNKKVTWTKI